ncbi:hypothetical protein INH39_16590 [Massilia violaceinigra]|uniref:DUF6985 domain-containing protein n=1 Tax=Massilia violaceinigra TaxID=2045208 RepID=A0ABY4AE79_9BURK|nr:hypothetical protein [Massilia violaceinigra]UOD33111.1 hypothetical protein INH39_16590 [Massilia violaceinigra]
MTTLTDNIIGELSFNHTWSRPYQICFFDELMDVRLSLAGDETGFIQENQRSAYAHFNANLDFHLKTAEAAIFKYYLSVCYEYRERFGSEFADRMAPIITQEKELKILIKPTTVLIQESFDSDERIVGLLYDCSWDTSLGLAVKFINENIDEVGPQDIIL